MIKVKDLWKSYQKKEVLQGLNLTVETGETVVILGRSGVGKSVLLRLIMGIEKPDRGSIEIDQKEITNLYGPHLYRSIPRMGMLFQGGALFDSMTVGENTAFYLSEHGDPLTGKSLSEEQMEQRVERALGMVGLEETAHLMPSALSGGMRKRAALARLIAYDPIILLYDEPTTGLDPITAMQINELIVKTKHELNASSIVVTHDLCTAFKVADRIALHHEGKIVHIAPKNEFVNIDHPVIQSFLENAMPNHEWDQWRKSRES